ncbi:hypothetical protein MTR67_029694 [Solanum verrucosum]|uniref:Uncharacterized protein n=1 Tax=Solanum verrucosum TaxID=315347 RepID=A0AAF0TXW8_SOLVR|nr:hypothetical protein MTR67_029694 [Solanum verrucosum]
MAFKHIAILLFFYTILQSQLHKSIALDETWIKAGYWQYDTTNPSNIQSINSSLYTHIIYGYADLAFNSSIDHMIVTTSNDEQLRNFNNIVKMKNPSVKTILSIGGNDQSSYGSEMYLLMSSTYFPTRKYFIDSSIEVARFYGFDGLDFCWIWPTSSQDMSNVATLLDDWRVAIDLESKKSKKTRLILTMASQYTPFIQDLSFPIESMRKNLDWIHVFAFDYYHPGTTNYTSPAAALYGDSTKDTLNTDYGINVWIKSGFPSEKIVLGLPFFGYVWTLVSPKNNQIGAEGIGPGPKDPLYGTEGEKEPFASTNGILEFNSIKRDMIKYRAKNSTYNSTYVMNYVSIGTTWVGFDDVEAVKTKVSYAKEKKLKGYVAWQVSYDYTSILSQAAALEVKDIQEVGAIDQSASMQKKKTLNRLILILIPMVSLLMLLLLIFTLWCLRRRKILKFRVPRNKIGSNNNEEKGDEETRTLQIFTFDEMKEATNNFSVENELGRGGYGPVYKISDFGMARIFKKDAIEANTNRIVGTKGYIPPEYAIEGRYSTKSDVFSFGVLLLQIISGKKNTCYYGPDDNLDLLDYAFEMWKDGEGMEFMDQSLDDTTHSCKLLKCMQIALLCVQKNPLDRPTMLEISSMFKNIENLVMNSPKRPAFSTRQDEDQVGNNIPNGELDIDNATITQLVAR